MITVANKRLFKISLHPKTVPYAPNFAGTCLCRASVSSNTRVYGWTLISVGPETGLLPVSGVEKQKMSFLLLFKLNDLGQ